MENAEAYGPLTRRQDRVKTQEEWDGFLIEHVSAYACEGGYARARCYGSASEWLSACLKEGASHRLRSDLMWLLGEHVPMLLILNESEDEFLRIADDMFHRPTGRFHHKPNWAYMGPVFAAATPTSRDPKAFLAVYLDTIATLCEGWREEELKEELEPGQMLGELVRMISQGL